MHACRSSQVKPVTAIDATQLPHRSEHVVPIAEPFYCRIVLSYLYRFHGWILAGVVETTHTMCFNRTFLHWLQMSDGPYVHVLGANKLGLEAEAQTMIHMSHHSTLTSYIYLYTSSSFARPVAPSLSPPLAHTTCTRVPYTRLHEIFFFSYYSTFVYIW